MPFVHYTRAHPEPGHAIAEALRRLLLLELAEIEETLQRQRWSRRKALCLNLPDAITWGGAGVR